MRLVALAAIALGTWLGAARAEEGEHPPAISVEAVTALRPIFAAAGPPNFQLGIEVAFDNGGTIKVTRKLVRNVSAGLVRMTLSERKLSSSSAERTLCRTEGTITAFFSGLQFWAASGASECGGTSSEIESRLIAVADIKGRLFPLQAGNELSFTTQGRGGMVDLFPGATHRLRVAGVLSGVTLNATGAPDVIYLIRNDEGPDGAKTPIVTDVYWSAGLRWPIQARMRTDDATVTLIESNLIEVTGVMPYVLPDGRTVSALDERTSRSHPLTEIDSITRALWRTAKSDTTRDVHDTAAVMARLVDPNAKPQADIDPAFAPIAAFVTREDAASQ